MFDSTRFKSTIITPTDSEVDVFETSVINKSQTMTYEHLYSNIIMLAHDHSYTPPTTTSIICTYVCILVVAIIVQGGVPINWNVLKFKGGGEYLKSQGIQANTVAHNSHRVVKWTGKLECTPQIIEFHTHSF